MAEGTRRPSRPDGPAGGTWDPPVARRPLALRIAIVVVAVVALWFLFVRTPGPGSIPTSALEAAEAAGCDDLERPVQADPGRDHLSPGASFDYPDRPPAAGPHDPSPLPGERRIYDEPVSETRAVHNLEHAEVLIWYRPATEGGISDVVLDALREVARNRDGVILAPYPDLPDGRALALVAWNTRWLCPAGLPAEAATEIAEGFVRAYRGTTNAPEAPRGLLGPLFVR